MRIFGVNVLCYIYISTRVGLVWFYGISTILGYLMSNQFYTYKQLYILEGVEILQYFGNIKHNLTFLGAFAEVVTNYTGIWDAKLTWYSLSTTH